MPSSWGLSSLEAMARLLLLLFISVAVTAESFITRIMSLSTPVTELKATTDDKAVTGSSLSSAIESNIIAAGTPFAKPKICDSILDAIGGTPLVKSYVDLSPAMQLQLIFKRQIA